MLIRLQSFLSQRGVASRRGAAEKVLEGRARVNGEIVLEPGFRVDEAADVVELDGAVVASAAPCHVTVMLNKPAGYVCSLDRSQGRSVCDLVADAGTRLLPVGRLDKDSEGLLLLSNDGGLIQKLTHPRHGHTKTYRVQVQGAINGAVMKSLRSPIAIDGVETRPADVERVGFDELRFTLGEGRNRQIRRLCERAGLRVERLTRVAVNTLRLPGDLPVGRWRALTPAELESL
ncbi:MAG: rRNA pseudouridine synthase [Kiritimatiellaeota bacterium]|nr:rRNA pseudouridine synthase [Kiritimatiellota bacterium]